MSSDGIQIILLIAGTLILVVFLRRYFENLEDHNNKAEDQSDSKREGGGK